MLMLQEKSQGGTQVITMLLSWELEYVQIIVLMYFIHVKIYFTGNTPREGGLISKGS